MKLKSKVTDIKWDVENNEDLENLPTEMDIPKELFVGVTDFAELSERVSDYLSDEYGFCHNGFMISYGPEYEQEFNSKVTDIKWDVDNIEDLENLPTEIDIPEELFVGVTNFAELSERVSDYLSDEYGFCHNGFIISYGSEYELEDFEHEQNESKHELEM